MSTVRSAIYALGAVAAVALALLVIPAIGLAGDIRMDVTWLFWVSFVALLVALCRRSRREPGRRAPDRGAGLCPVSVQ